MSPRLRSILGIFTAGRFFKYGRATNRHGHKKMGDMFETKVRPPKQGEISWLHVIATALTASWWLPSYVYRLSLKASSPLLLGFAYPAMQLRKGRLPLPHRLEAIRNGAASSLRRKYVLLIAATTIAPVVLHVVGITFIGSKIQSVADSSGEELRPLLTALQHLYFPVRDSQIALNGWHIARLINCILVYAAWVYADSAIRSLQVDIAEPQTIESKLSMIFAFQWFLSAYLWICCVACVWQYMHHPGVIPPVELRWFP